MNTGYDLAVVGTGFASTFFLHEYLRHAPKDARVVVLEWSRGKDRETQVNFASMVENRTPHKGWVQNIAFGGGSCWTGTTPRPHPSDFAMRSDHGIAQDWPVTYDDLDPYLCDVEDLMAIAGEEGGPFPRSRPYRFRAHALCSFGRTLRRHHPDHVIPMPSARASDPGSGRAPCCATGSCSACPMGAKFEVGRHMRGPYEDPRVTLQMGARVERLDLAGGRVTGVEFTRDGRRERVRCDMAALGAHAIFNPYICLRSGLDDDALGRYLHEQTSVDVKVHFAGLKNLDGGQQVTGLGTMFLDHAGRADWAGCNLELWNVPWLRAERGRWTERAVLKFVFEVEPQRENRVTISADDGRPVVDHPRVCEWNRRGEARVPELMERLARDLPVEGYAVLDKQGPEGEAHIQGTARMSHSEEDGVVDAGLIHHRVRNLAILGASAFPSCPAANPTIILSALSLMSARRLMKGAAS